MRRLWPGAVAIATLLALAALFYRGLIQGLILGDYDAFVYFYPLRHYAAEAVQQGRLPLWNPGLFLGAPFFANIQTGVLYPPNLLFAVMPVPHAFSASVILHVLLAGVSMYIFGRRVLDLAALPALTGAVAFMLSGFLAAQSGHINQLNASAWLPLLLVFFEEALRRSSLSWALATGLLGAWQFLAGHTQEWYFSMVVLGLFALWRTVSLRRVRPLAYLALAVVVLAGTAAVQILPTLELSRESLRGGGMSYWEASSFSLPPTSALYTLLPSYPTTLFSEYVGYVGVVALVLAALAVAQWAVRPVSLLMAFLALLGLFMAFGRYNPLYVYLFDLVPGLDLFRVPARWLFVYTFGIAALAGLGAQLVLDAGERRRGAWWPPLSHWVIPAGIRVLVSALFLGGGALALLVLWRLADPHPARDQLAVWAGLAAVGAVAAGIGFLGPRAGRLSMAAVLAVLVVELGAAGGEMDYRYPIPAEAYRPERASTSYILASEATSQEPGRVLSFATDHYEVKETPDYRQEYSWLPEESLIQFLIAVKLSETLAPNIPIEYGLQTVDGYDGGVLPLKRFAEFKSLMISDDGVPADNPLRHHLDYLPAGHFLDLMNVRYVLGARLQDTQVDGVYYDRGITIQLGPGESTTIERIPDVATTSIGLISSTEGARELSDGVEVAELLLTGASGEVHRLPIRMGTDTGETPARDGELPPVAHVKPRSVGPWTPEIKDEDYFTRLQIPEGVRIEKMTFRSLLPQGTVRIRAATLMDGAGATSHPLVLSDRFDRELFFDTKVYLNRQAQPRAFLVNGTTVREDAEVLEELGGESFAVNEVALIAPSPTARSLPPGAGPAGTATIRSYGPERVVAEVDAAREGYLVLQDTFYPGWRAEVDGREVPIERANYLFRAVLVPEGSHQIVFSYQPDSFRLGLGITGFTLIAVFACLAFLGLQSGRRRGEGVI